MNQSIIKDCEVKKGMASAAIGLGMMAQALSGCSESGGQEISPTPTEDVTPQTTTESKDQAKDRREAALALLDRQIECDEGVQGEYNVATTLNQTNFTDKAESVRLGLDLSDYMLGFQVTYTPPADTPSGELRISPFAYNFADSGEPQTAPEETDIVIDTSMLDKRGEVYEMPGIADGQGFGYQIFLFINKPDDIEASLSIACSRMPIETEQEVGGN